MKNLFFILFISLLTVGCTSQKVTEDAELLHHTKITIPEMLIGRPVNIQSSDSNLLIIDYGADSLFHWIDTKNHTYKGSFGIKGQGPGEWNHPQKIHFLGKNNVYCYDVGTSELKTFNLNNFGQISSSNIFKGSILTFDIMPISDSLFVINGYYEKSAFRTVNNEGRIIDMSGTYPYKNEEEKSIPDDFRSLAYQGTMRTNGRQQFVFVTSHARQIYLYKVTSDGNIIKTGEIIDSYAQYVPDYSTKGSYSVAFDSEVPECYKDVIASDKYIYALYSGRTYKDYKLSCNECESLYVYDWTGKFVRLYKLDVPVTNICLNEQQNKLYGIANIPDPALVSFDL
ncbi:BF3164 family lipoprotein [Bacteroides sp.]